MQHFYGIIPNERNPETGEEKYMVVWGTVFEDSSMCYVPASPIYKKNIHFALNDTLDHCIQESKKASDGKYEIRLYKRVSNDPKSDDYYSFTLEKKFRLLKRIFDTSIRFFEKEKFMAYKFNKEAAARKRAEQVNEGIKIIEEEVPRFFQSEKWKNYLCFVSKFHKYSINNTILIFHQRPDASMVAGYQNWKKMGRTVNKGEKGIMIFVPTPYKVHMQEKLKDQNGNPVFDENGDEKTEKKEIKKMAFRIGHVFDVKQTSGDPIPEIVSPLKGDDDVASKYMYLADKITRCPICFKNADQEPAFRGGAYGYYSPTYDRIVVRSDMSEKQKLKTIFHEIAHSYLHSDKKGQEKEKEQKECEAESVAFILCRHLGLDVGGYTFGYLASWAEGKDAKFLKGVLENIKSVSCTLIEKCDAAIENAAEEQEECY